jgi:hypothetical protein
MQVLLVQQDFQSGYGPEEGMLMNVTREGGSQFEVEIDHQVPYSRKAQREQESLHTLKTEK